MKHDRTSPCSTAVVLLTFAMAILPFATPGRAQTLAFPGAQGFGRYATGGRGGTVYHVTTTNDSGPGSFRDAVSVSGRTVVFDIGGIIDYQSPRYAPKPNITIAGQTAPGGGVAIYGNGLSFSGSHNNIVRFLRVREGINGDDGTDAMGIANGHDMIFDHVSVSWGRDETFSISGPVTNITIQSSIVSQGLQDHSAGGLIQTDGGVSILRSLYIDNDTRNPKVKGVNEYVNNVVYGWETAAYIMGGDSAGDSYANVINNYLIKGPNSAGSPFSGGNTNFHIYASNNWQDTDKDGVLDGAVVPQSGYGTVDWQTSPYPYPIASALPPLTALKLALSDAGDAWQRDVVDQRLMTELTSWGVLGETIFTEFDPPMNGPGVIAGGVAPTDTDQDGMPDYWELGTGSNPNVANNNDPSPSGSGYTRLEDYLNWLADPHGVAPTNTTVDVDLRQFTRGFTNSSPVYSVSGGTNGTVTLLNAYIARFVPTTGFAGQAGFSFSVVDADGSTLTRPMNLFFTPQAAVSSLTWRGDGVTNTWDTLGAYNWFDGQSLLYPFHAGDTVRFDDTGYNVPNINLVGSLQPASITVNSTHDYTFSGSGSLDSSFTLNKTGSGTLTLANTNNGFGTITVSNGTLLVNGDLSQSSVAVQAGATVGGIGRFGSAVALASGSSLAPGHALGSPGTLTISNGLSLWGGVTLRFDLTDDPSGTTKTNDRVDVIGGSLLLSGANAIQVNLLDGPLANGVYTLINCSGVVGSLSSLTLVGANGVLTNPPGQIALLVDNTRPPANLVWLGNAGNNNWDNGTNAAWLNGVTQDRFYFGDTVRFDDTGSTSPPVNLVGTLSPASVTVDATKNYTFSGSGRISGTTGLTKTNSGVLTIAAVNDYSGVTTLGGGVLAVAQLPNGGVAGTIGAAGTDPSNLVFNGGVLRYTGASGGTDHGAKLNAGGGTIEVSSGSTVLTLNGVLTGTGALTKAGLGRLDGNAISDYSGGTIVTEGTIRLVNTAGLGSGALTLNGDVNGAALLFGADAQTLGNTLNIIGANNFSTNSGNNTITTLTGSGTVQLYGASGNTFTLAGNMSGFSGTLAVKTLSNLRFNPSSGSSSATFDLGTGSAKLNNRNGLTANIGALIGGSSTILEGASSANTPSTYIIGGKNLSTTFAGKIQEVIPARSVAIVKVGSGTLTLTGASTYNGGTTVNAGTLLVNNASGSSTGTNSVAVNSGGTLGGTGSIRGAVAVNSGGVLAPGSGGIGTLTVNNTLTLTGGAVLGFEIGATSDRVAVATNLVLGGTLNVSNAPGFGRGTNILFTYGGALSGSLALGPLPAGYAGVIDTGTAGQVRLIVSITAQPSFSNAVASAGGIVVSGGGGTANGTYYVLASTNVALPIASWTRIATNAFSAAGGFTFTNSLNPGTPQQFYRLQLP